MRTPLKTMLAAATLVAGIATVQGLYAQTTGNTPEANVPPASQDNMAGKGHTGDQGSMTGKGHTGGQGGMMGQGHKGGQGGMMGGQGGMMGMMGGQGNMAGKGHAGGQGNMAGKGHAGGQGSMAGKGHAGGQGNMMGMMGQMHQMMQDHSSFMQAMLDAHGIKKPAAQ